MSDTPITPHGDEALEARIVSWVLGEASAFEAAELERLCEERPELLVFKRRMRVLHGLLTEAEASKPDEGWKLPEEKRRALDELFGDAANPKHDAEKDRRVNRSGRRALLAIAACLVLTMVVLSLLPGRYEASTTIEVSPYGGDTSALGAAMNEESVGNRMTPQFLAPSLRKSKAATVSKKSSTPLALRLGGELTRRRLSSGSKKASKPRTSAAPTSLKFEPGKKIPGSPSRSLAKSPRIILPIGARSNNAKPDNTSPNLTKRSANWKTGLRNVARFWAPSFAARRSQVEVRPT